MVLELEVTRSVLWSCEVGLTEPSRMLEDVRWWVSRS